MANERVTENLVRSALRTEGYFSPKATSRVEEQKTEIEAARKALSSASKAGGGKHGSPEFIISDSNNADFILIFECKAATKDHASAITTIGLSAPAAEDAQAYIKRVTRFAVDGVLHYARHLSKNFNVIAVAVSGQTKGSLQISTFLHPKNADAAKWLNSKDGSVIDQILPWADYLRHATFDPSIQAIRHSELMAFSRELHDFMRDDVKASESEKPLFVSGSLIALKNKAFAKSFTDYTPEDFPKAWLQTIETELNKAKIPNSKLATVILPYSNIAAHPELPKVHKKYPRGVLNELVGRLNEKVWPFISVENDFDVVGQFYGEFLKYTGGDKKALGIVLTPRHITELFALLANVNKDSKVLDICAGTGGFLIAAMHQMFKTAMTEAERNNIKKNGLIGVEQQPNMFALAASNMLLRGDGKANLYQGSCFDKELTAIVASRQCNVGLLNPPFSQGDADLHELYFVMQMLDCLAPNGVGLAIVPINCAISPHVAKAEILKKHTLIAVMSLPNELFAPVGTVTCAMIFTAHVPHVTSGTKTWFGYWRDDGFVRTKHLGRIDQKKTWPNIRDRWVEQFRNREVHAGESVTQLVGSEDEWCAEAYMETDYSTLTRAEFEAEIKRYFVTRLLNGTEDGAVHED